MTNEDAQTPECGATLAEYVVVERRLRQAIHDAYAALEVFKSEHGMDMPDMSLALARALLEAAERYRAVEAPAVLRWGLPSIREALNGGQS